MQERSENAMNALRLGDTSRAVALSRAVLKESPPASIIADMSAVLLQSGKTGEAEAAARRALKSDPRSDRALSVLVSICLNAKRDAEAIPLLTRLQTVRGGEDPVVSQSLTYAYYRTGDRKGALNEAERFAAQVPKSPEAILAVITLAVQSDNRAVAEKYLVRLAKILPKSPLPAYYRGRFALSETGKPVAARLDTAEKAFREAVRLVPQDPIYRTELGTVLITQAGYLTGAAQTTKLSAARTELTAALLQENHNFPARRALAVVAEGEKNWLDAAAQYEAVLKLAPGDNAARRRYAGVLLSAGRKSEGYTQFYELATRMPRDTLHLKELASFLMNDKLSGKARAAYGQVLERAPGDPDALIGMGQAYSDENKFPQARDAYRAAIVAGPKRETPYLLLAQLYINDGETDGEAIATLEALLAARPDSQIGRDQLIERYILAKRDNDARREIGKLVLRKNDPNRNRYRLALGNLLMVREKWAEAITEFERIAPEEPDNPAVLIALAGAYGKARRSTDAATTYEKAATAAENALRNDWRDAEARNTLLQARTAQNNTNAATDFLTTLDAAGGTIP